MVRLLFLCIQFIQFIISAISILTIAVSKTIQRNFDGSGANCGFDDDSAQFRSAARIMAVLTTIQSNFDWGFEESWFQRRFRDSLIGGVDNCGVDDDSAQF